MKQVSGLVGRRQRHRLIRGLTVKRMFRRNSALTETLTFSDRFHPKLRRTIKTALRTIYFNSGIIYTHHCRPLQQMLHRAHTVIAANWSKNGSPPQPRFQDLSNSQFYPPHKSGAHLRCQVASHPGLLQTGMGPIPDEVKALARILTFLNAKVGRLSQLRR